MKRNTPSEADIIIVGAGSAGCVLADQLSACGRYQVLLIEAGPCDNSFLFQMPKGFGKTLVSDTTNWRPQTDALSPLTHTTQEWSRGRVLGGSSSVNGMIYARGQSADFDALAKAGLSGWGWPEIGTAYKAIEDHELGPNLWRGKGGPLGISLHPKPEPIQDAVIEAGRQRQWSVLEDMNDSEQARIGYYPRTIKDGVRQSASTCFLRQAMKRPNLHVLTNTTVEQVVLDDENQAIAVRAKGKYYRARAEIILAANTVHTPKILMLSGIGDGAELAKHGIEVRVESETIGKNMAEHCCLLIQHRLRRGFGYNHRLQGLGLARELIRYMISKKGILAQAAFESGAFIKTRPDLDHPDAQLLMAPFSVRMDSPQALRLEKEAGFHCLGYALHPTSRGNISLHTANPNDPVRISPNYLATSDDQETALAMISEIRALFDTPALKQFFRKETFPGRHLGSGTKLLETLVTHSMPGGHAVGTCAMGTALDARCRLKGTSRLRVVDASIFPNPISGNTNGPVMAAAWNAASMILPDLAA